MAGGLRLEKERKTNHPTIITTTKTNKTKTATTQPAAVPATDTTPA